MSAASWERNGSKYWQLKTKTAEIVAVMPASYTPHTPALHAQYEVYSIDKHGLAKFLGYLQGEHAVRAHLCFAQAFSR